MVAPGLEPKPRLSNHDEYYRMSELELLGPDEKAEPIEGPVIWLRANPTIMERHIPVVQKVA